MRERFVYIWFRFLKTDWHSRRNTGLRKAAFALTKKERGRLVISANNALAAKEGIYQGMVLADARAIYPGLLVADDRDGHEITILNGLGAWCIRFTPWVAVDLPDGLILNATGCAHLWGGEVGYIAEIARRLNALGYDVSIAMADTIGAAYAASRFANSQTIVQPSMQRELLQLLPPAALRLEPALNDRLSKLGIHTIGELLRIAYTALRRRFGQHVLLRIEQALGNIPEIVQPVQPVTIYQHRLPCIEPITARTGIEIAVQTLLEQLCKQLSSEGNGLRSCTFTCFRVDGKTQNLTVGTNRSTAHRAHLFRLFENKLDKLEPALGFELFTITADKIEPCLPLQEKLWQHTAALESAAVAELLDRLTDRFGIARLSRFLPDAHHWPERSVKKAASINEQPAVPWQSRRRPVKLLSKPHPITVTAPIPDYPPMNFQYRGTLYTVKKADGPERIEQEWWLSQGEHRDYYCVEDATGGRYWIFRSGHYDSDQFGGWFLHGFFA